MKTTRTRNLSRSLNYSLTFEFAMMQFFGEKAHGIASRAGHKALTKEWLLKAVKRMMRNVDEIDTTVRHKEQMLQSLGFLEDAIKKWDILEEIIFLFFMLCSQFLGYDFFENQRHHNLIYWQTPGRYDWTGMLQGGDAMQYYRDGKDAISVRKRLINELKQEGYSDFKISLILNTTEYEIKKLKRG